MGEREVIVEVEQVTRRFGDHVVVEPTDLQVYAGEVLGLIGPNGAGKSTLLMMLAGLVRPSSGTIRVGGLIAHKVALKSTGVIGLITAHAGLYPLLTGRENLHFFGKLCGLSVQETNERVEPLLSELGLGPELERRTGTYSSGMQQKVSLARALLLDPKVLLLDEPTSNLDPLSAYSIYRAVRRRADRGLAVVLATHDLIAAEQICDRAALCRAGVRHIETFDGPRQAPEPGRLMTAWQDVLETS
jgi:ABC-2 type transport system ATP-binding protein